MIAFNSRFLTQRTTGVQRFASEIARRLKPLLPDAKFLSPANIIHAELATWLGATSPTAWHGHLWEQAALPVYLGTHGRPLLVNLANTAPLLYGKQIVTICDLSFMKNPEWFSKSFYGYYSFLLPRVARSAAMVVTISEFSRLDIIERLKVRAEKVRVVPCAVSDSFIDKNAGKTVKNEYGRYILVVSSIEPRKNLKRLIAAYNKVSASDRDVKLVVVGAENKAVFSDEDLKGAISDQKKIIFKGYVPDEELSRLYQNAELFVYPSLFEGFGIPPLEAMASGCPVVASNTSSLPEICTGAAVLVDPYSPEAIAEGISSVLGSPALKADLREKGFTRLKKYNWKDSAEKFKQIIEEVAQ